MAAADPGGGAIRGLIEKGCGWRVALRPHPDYVPRPPDRWPSGRRRAPGKCVYVKSVSWVRIPPHPPSTPINYMKFLNFFRRSPNTRANRWATVLFRLIWDLCRACGSLAHAREVLGRKIGASPHTSISRQCAAMPQSVPAPKAPEMQAAPAPRTRARGFDVPPPPGSFTGAQGQALDPPRGLKRSLSFSSRPARPL